MVWTFLGLSCLGLPVISIPGCPQFREVFNHYFFRYVFCLFVCLLSFWGPCKYYNAWFFSVFLCQLLQSSFLTDSLIYFLSLCESCHWQKVTRIPTQIRKRMEEFSENFETNWPWIYILTRSLTCVFLSKLLDLSKS